MMLDHPFVPLITSIDYVHPPSSFKNIANSLDAARHICVTTRPSNFLVCE